MTTAEAVKKLSEHQAEIATSISKLTSIVSSMLERIKKLERKP